MILLRRVLGDALRARRQAQHRTLREVSGAANVSLGYLSEIERGQKEASSELLSSICDALGAQLSEVLREVSDTLELAELTAAEGLRPVPVGSDGEAFAPAAAPAPRDGSVTNFVGDGGVSVAVRRDGPLRTTLKATRTRDIIRAA
ncbi:transcriptional regulator [Virgisporangium aliadipatigenens]|uniref:Transcriptional regulator n=1 Tax=Virgisporangium aliadipatigenens TaxID=741659 RepID=A0A8J3YL42_9ACTN|nr:helix-turn-helix transcriptional regulator [Virgisporangium aliadipatigenens]GIJ45900.1 transcriptional regulator [Virgisporangium aliadipatigenens]